ncbi:hypothetical protein [Candidatus Solirubrobacter pratensis]|uniref:hypothetical protein n=1 Tax=Candidatus Solirubrobacter pratensis TaxID=1298857 RepID=UPI0003FB3B66|nr:hypothetical protein [Candidatus Solirubrobacter pratensis]
MASTNASGGTAAAAEPYSQPTWEKQPEPYSQPTWEKQPEPAFAVFALAGGAELAPGAGLVLVGLFPGKTRQHDAAPAARARLAELGWSDDDARGARLVSFRPVHARTTPALPDAGGAGEHAPAPVEAAGAAAGAAGKGGASEPQSGRKRRARGSAAGDA